MSALRVFDMGDDVMWWLAPSAEVALASYMKDIDQGDLLEPLAPRELAEAELDQLIFDDREGNECSFREKLAREIARDPITTRPFASAEY